MIKSFIATRSPGTNLFVYVDELDPHVEQYREMIGRYAVDWEIGPHKYQPEVHNYAVERYPEAEYYGEVNDDHIYRTTGWDLMLVEGLKKNRGWGISYGWTQNYPTATMISAKTVRALGYWEPRGLKHLFVDLCFMDLFGALQLMRHVPEAVIEHMHAHFGKAQTDAVYQWVYSGEVNEHDSKRYNEWRANELERDKQIIRDAMARESQQA